MKECYRAKFKKTTSYIPCHAFPVLILSVDTYFFHHCHAEDIAGGHRTKWILPAVLAFIHRLLVKEKNQTKIIFPCHSFLVAQLFQQTPPEFLYSNSSSKTSKNKNPPKHDFHFFLCQGALAALKILCFFCQKLGKKVGFFPPNPKDSEMYFTQSSPFLTILRRFLLSYKSEYPVS